MESRFVVTVGTDAHAVEVVAEADGRVRVRVDDEWLEVDARGAATGPYSLLIGPTAYLVDVTEEGGDLILGVGGEVHRARVDDPGRRRARPGADTANRAQQRLVAPMPGKVVSVHVQPGSQVQAGTPLVVLEAMKMENEFRATAAGRVIEVRVEAGQAVNAGDLLIVIA